MHVSGLFQYPLKSGRGIALQASDFDAHGLAGDRRLVLAAPDGTFVTQRDMQALAMLAVTPGADGYRLSMQGKGSLHVARPSGDNRLDVTIWDATISAAIADAEANRVLSEWLGQDLVLAFYDDRSHRHASENWAEPETPVTFTDGFPVLVTTTASLAALNADMAAHGEGEVGMERFRPNIVIDCDEPWAEDRWAALEIGGIRFDLVKPCTRCIMTSQDQLTGSRAVPSPIPAMGRIRMSTDRRAIGPLFGWNAAPRGSGRLALGDSVRVIGDRPEGWPLKRR